jgi:hypothetical protein
MKFKIGDVVKYTEIYKKIAKTLGKESDIELGKSYVVEKLHKLSKKPHSYVLITKCGTKFNYSGNMEIDVEATRKNKISNLFNLDFYEDREEE